MRAVLISMLAMFLYAPAHAGEVAALLSTIQGKWEGDYCGDGSRTTWWIETDINRAWARERWCNPYACGDIDYRILNVTKDDSGVMAVYFEPFYVTGYSQGGYLVKLTRGRNGVLNGRFINHPRCGSINLTRKLSSQVEVKPLSTKTPDFIKAAHFERCREENIERAIASCTVLIDKGAYKDDKDFLSTTYMLRGVHYLLSGKKLDKEGKLSEAFLAFESAIDDLEKARAISPKDAYDETLAAIYIARARFLSSVGRCDRALNDYQSALTLGPDNEYREIIYAERSRCRYQLKDNAAAENDVSTALAIASKGPGPASEDLAFRGEDLAFRGHVRLTIGNFQGAIDDYTEALKALRWDGGSGVQFHERASDDQYWIVKSLYERGVARRALRDRENGDADIASALALNPKFVPDWREYNYWRRSSGQ